MITAIRALALTAVLCLASTLHAQAPRVKVSNDDARWGETIKVSYTAKTGTLWANADNTDTLFCAAIIRGAFIEHAMILPMRHTSDSLYETDLTVPDSTNSIRIEICIPTDRVPDGITQFTCRTTDGKATPGAILQSSTNINSALTADLTLYPKDYTAYVKAYDIARNLQQSGTIKFSDADRKKMLISSTDKLLAHPDNSASWHLGLASLYLRRGRDSLAQISLENAARCQGWDPVFNDVDFWSSFFAPRMTDSKITMPITEARTLAPLVDRYHRTSMAAAWIRISAYDTLLAVTTFKHVAQSWSSSHDVDVLESIAQAFAFKLGPAYDAKAALKWFNRAEESSRTFSGFYSGDNIFSSMGRMGGILAGKARILAAVGKTDEAITMARVAMVNAKQPYQKQELASVLAFAYLDAGRLDDAKRAYGMALASSTRSTMDGLDALYERTKQGSETEDEFVKRLVTTYGKEVDLPAIPDFAYTTLDGASGTLEGLRGKVVVLDCWFTTCAGCIIEKASLNKLVDSYKGNPDVVFLSIALNDATTIKHFLEHTPSKFKIVPDGQDICSKIGVSGFPTHIVIGRDGRTLGFDEGGSETEGDAMRPKIERALGK